MAVAGRTYLLDITREELLDLLDKDKCFVEVGVAEGAFSQEIFRRCHPSRLSLVDPWKQSEDASYVPDLNNVEDRQQEERFQSVSALFSGQDVDICRQTSLEAARQFPDGSLDYVYIDAMHTQQAVMADLEAWGPKLKDDGLLMGHDYANHIIALKSGFGVVEAVNQFVADNGYCFIGITSENYPYPSYILSKSWHGKAREIHDRAHILCSFELERMRWELLPMPDGSTKVFPRF